MSIDDECAEPTNEQRAARIPCVISYYAETQLGETLTSDSAGTTYDMLAGLLADIRHFCDAHGLSFDDAVRISMDHYMQELPVVELDSPIPPIAQLAAATETLRLAGGMVEIPITSVSNDGASSVGGIIVRDDDRPVPPPPRVWPPASPIDLSFATDWHIESPNGNIRAKTRRHGDITAVDRHLLFANISHDNGLTYEQRILVARIAAAGPAMIELISDMAVLIDEAINVHIYGEDDVPDVDCPYHAAVRDAQAMLARFLP